MPSKKERYSWFMENGKRVIRSGFGIHMDVKRAQKEIIAVGISLAGLAISLVGPLKGLPASLLMGFSVGAILSTLAIESALKAYRPALAEVPFATQQQLPTVQQWEPRQKDHKTLDEFDKALSTMKKKNGSSPQMVETMDKAMAKLYAEYPEWEGEGRLRTYTVLKKISDLLDRDNVDSYMGMTFRMLQERNGEAAEYTRTLLNGRVEKMYRDPEFEGSKYLAGTLIMMNRTQKEYIEEIIGDALHLWSEPRFQALKPELSILSMLKQEDRDSVGEMLMKEITKAKMVNDRKVVSRARVITKALAGPKTQARKTVAPIPHAS